MKKRIITSFQNIDPSASKTIAAGYALGQEWYNTATGEKFYHKTDGVWVSVDTSATTLGLIKIVDKDGDFFTDLATASAYIRQFTSATITDESYSNDTFWFTVPNGSSFANATYFLGSGYFKNAYIEDVLGLINEFGSLAFINNTGNNVLGDATFSGGSAFGYSTGINIFGNVICNGANNFFGCKGSYIFNNFTTNIYGCFTGNEGIIRINGDYLFSGLAVNNNTGLNSQGRFEFYGNIGTDETANYPNFFPSSTAVIWAQKVKETSNAGGIEGDLATARTNGAKLFFGYALSGSGTTNYITKWTPDGTSLGNSTAYEDSSGRWGIGTTGTTFAQLNISTPQISGRESILTTQVDDNILDRYILANGTTTSSRFIPTHVGFVDGTYQSLIFRGLGLTANDSGTSPYVEFRAATTSSSTDPNNGVLLNPTIKPLFSWGSVTEAMRIVANGNVGIGTTLPTSTLHVSSFTNVAQFEYAGFTGTNNFKFTSSIINDEISLEATRNSVTTQLIGYDDNNKAFFNSYSVVSSGGLVGIGVTGPTAKLHVAASTTLAAMMRLEVGTAPTSPNDGDVWLESNTTTGLKIQLGGVTRTITIT